MLSKIKRYLCNWLIHTRDDDYIITANLRDEGLQKQMQAAARLAEDMEKNPHKYARYSRAGRGDNRRRGRRGRRNTRSSNAGHSGCDDATVAAAAAASSGGSCGSTGSSD